MNFKPDPADSIGLITNYRCTYSCRHCLYCSSPHIIEIVREDILMNIINEIDRNLKVVFLHIGGGEPLLNFDLIKRLLPYILKTKIVLEYIETNGFFLLKDTLLKLNDLKSHGLNRLLLSISPFHNEFISVKDIKRLYSDIISVLGADGIFPWNPGYFYFLERFPGDRPVKLEEYFEKFSLSEILYQLTSVMYIHPGGRAGYFFSGYMDLHPPEELFNIACYENLASPVHVHIDYDGNYITGFCSGLRIGEEMGLELKKLYSEGIDLNEYPLLHMLINKGLKELYEFSLTRGYVPRKEGYVSPCHLCLDLRVYLYFKETYKELYPSFLYEELGNLVKITGSFSD